MTDYTQVNPEMAEMEARVKELEREHKRVMAGRIIGAAITIGSVVAAVYCGKKLKDVMGVVNSAVTDVSSLTYIDVQQAVVDRAVEKAAQNAAGKAVKATEGLMHSMVEKAVTSAVVNAKEPLKQAVVDKIAMEVALIDKSELVSDIEEQAKQLIVDKFEGKLDGIAADFSRNLENVGKIYQTIAESMTQKPAPEKTPTLIQL
ncbi:MAG: hypothetical protein J6U54_01195 [Clostridiales bacterium]|nr:hypothetical protein [Clostridiales bacterium]